MYCSHSYTVLSHPASSLLMREIQSSGSIGRKYLQRDFNRSAFLYNFEALVHKASVVAASLFSLAQRMHNDSYNVSVSFVIQ